MDDLLWLSDYYSANIKGFHVLKLRFW